jgi:translation elongation factor EF-1alpha
MHGILDRLSSTSLVSPLYILERPKQLPNTVYQFIDKVEVPTRSLEAPLRFPISNVFKGQTAVASGVGVTGRLSSGVVQVGERLRVVPGDETGLVRSKPNTLIST